MCISTTPRNHAVLSRPAVDTAQLWSSFDAHAFIKPSTEQFIADDHSSLIPAPITKKQTRHITVVHDYHDHANDRSADYIVYHPARGGVTTPFPIKLHEMLLSTVEEGMEHIVSWQPHGRCFLVHKPKEFTELLPRFFKLSKLASFQRQLNLYGFQRLTRGNDRGGYYHELFLRDREFLAHSINRIKVKGTGIRARSSPEQEPDFWSVLPWIDSENSSYVPPQQVDDDVIVGFGNKTFHLLEPRQGRETPLLYSDAVPSALSPQDAQVQTPMPCDIESLVDVDADAFFQDFEFPDELGVEIEDDELFGNLLEQIIA